MLGLLGTVIWQYGNTTMIKYDLICEKDHEFEAWFRSSEAYDEQQRAGVLSCPFCAGCEVRKAITAPQVVRTDHERSRRALAPQKHSATLKNNKTKGFLKAVRELRRHVAENADYVGKAFSEEARRIHYGESQKRNIYGEASVVDARKLDEEGIAIMPLPILPEDRN